MASRHSACLPSDLLTIVHTCPTSVFLEVNSERSPDCENCDVHYFASNTESSVGETQRSQNGEMVRIVAQIARQLRDIHRSCHIC